MVAATCWRCGGALEPAVLCASCGAVQAPPPGADHFTVLGLPVHPAVDEQVLSERYYEISRRVHPDRFQASDPRELAQAVSATAAVNSAFWSLRDVESRGRYWLERAGGSLGRDNASVPSALAATVFEVQEKLDELRHASGEARSSVRGEVDRTREELERRRAERRSALESMLRDWPDATNGTAVSPANGSGAANGSARANGSNGAHAPTRGDQAALKALLSELSYLRTLERDVRAALES
ncbi:MAG: hypothetical protein ACKOCT_02705 [Alphaproteobacteria bacterium]